MPPKGAKGKGGARSSKGGYHERGGGDTISFSDFMASNGTGATTPANPATTVGVGAEASALQQIAAALQQTPRGDTFKPGTLKTVKFNSVAEQQRMVMAMSLLKEKEAKDEDVRFKAMVQAGIKAHLGSPKRTVTPPGKGKQKQKTQEVDEASEDETGDDSSAEQTGLTSSSRNAKHKKRQREEYRLLKDTVPALRSFYEEVSGMLDDDRGTESDDEVKGSGVARIMRRIRSAKREYRNTTPSPKGKLGNRSPSQGDPVKGMSSKANVASRRLRDQLDTSTDAPSETSGGSSDLMQALRGHFVTPPSPSTKQTIPKKQTPIALFQAILDSLKGAAEMVDVKDHPIPDGKLFKKLATKPNLAKVKPLVDNLQGVMVKAAKAMKTKRTDADLSAQTMLTEGLGDTIGYRIPRSVNTESYIAVLLIWLIQAGVDLTGDPYTNFLLTG
jgi:hypothetical protein